MKSKLIGLGAAGGTYLALLVVIYVIHVNFFPVNVVFYAAIGDGLLAAVLVAVLLAFLPWFRRFTGFEKVLLVLIGTLAGYAFAISVPTVLDRSLSFYILEKIDQRGGGILKNRFADVFTKEYLVEHRLVDVRLTEQLESGTIEDDSGCIVLTEKGKRLTKMSRWFRQNLLPKHRLLMGEYTDDLTDPFRHSADSSRFDYQCQSAKGNKK